MIMVTMVQPHLFHPLLTGELWCNQPPQQVHLGFMGHDLDETARSIPLCCKAIKKTRHCWRGEYSVGRWTATTTPFTSPLLV